MVTSLFRYGCCSVVWSEFIDAARSAALASLREIRGQNEATWFVAVIVDPAGIESSDNPTSSPMILGSYCRNAAGAPWMIHEMLLAASNGALYAGRQLLLATASGLAIPPGNLALTPRPPAREPLAYSLEVSWTSATRPQSRICHREYVAAHAYDQGARQFRKDYAQLNFPPPPSNDLFGKLGIPVLGV